MKKLCIFLISVNRWYYGLLGTLLALLFYSQVDDIDKLLPEYVVIFLCFCFVFIPIIAVHSFYSDEEIKFNQENGKLDPIPMLFYKWDNYFPYKINTELSVLKRLSGYVYAISRPLPFVMFSYVLSVIVISGVLVLFF